MLRNHSRSLAALLLALVLTLNMTVCLADSAKYATTKDFLRALEKHGTAYTYQGLHDDDELVSVSFPSTFYGTVTMRFCFDDDADEVSIHIDLLSTAVEAGTAALAVNALNAECDYAKFLLDTRNGSIFVENDLPIDGTDGDKLVRLMNELLDEVTDDDCLDLLKALK